MWTMFGSHLAVVGLVSHCELDKWTGTAGHFFTGLQKKKNRFYKQERAMVSRALANSASIYHFFEFHLEKSIFLRNTKSTDKFLYSSVSKGFL